MTYLGSSIRPSVPKPYDIVPLAPVRRFEMPGQDRVVYDEKHFSGRLTFEIRTLSPVFVSNGRFALSEDLGLPPGLAVRGCYRIGGQPAIPASSLKGVVRSVAEAVSPSCVTTTRAHLSKDAADTNRCQIGPGKRACPACALFGSGGEHAHIGLVRFEDAILVGNRTETKYLPPLFRPRREPSGRKFYFHGQTASVDEGQGDLCQVIPEGSSLRSSVSFVNLDEALVGLFLFALGLDGTFKLKLGGGKPACLGSIELVPAELWRDTGQSFTQADRGGEIWTDKRLEQFVRDRIAVAEREERLLKPQRAKLREILRFPNPRECPTGMY